MDTEGKLFEELGTDCVNFKEVCGGEDGACDCAVKEAGEHGF